MASIFTYQEEPPRVHSPWSTSGSATPQGPRHFSATQSTADGGQVTTIIKLEPERQDGPTEYKLHLLLRSRKYQAHNVQVDALPRSSADSVGVQTPPLQPNNSRQARLQQLTTQLLWRLQQSSPFHSSSNADLVLPILPEATPRLGVPDRPAKLLPGLEESQGALYEIGVSDDGTLVGLVEEELEESLNNLRAMAASLGCVVDILRRILIDQNEQNPEQQVTMEENQKRPKMWVAEVLVRPETKSPSIPPLEEINATNAIAELRKGNSDVKRDLNKHIEQLRIAVTGPTTAGKSSLVGTLTTSKLDNGRGKSRLSLLKHRHEIASGITSSVAQELLGYRKRSTAMQTVINYATGDVSSWPDIHNLANRLVFLSDSPGLPRYAKSTFRTLVSWDPHRTLVCIAANGDDSTFVSPSFSGHAPPSDGAQYAAGSTDSIDLSLAHLSMCLKLDLPLIIVITKMDIATKSALKIVLSKILSTLKLAGKVPALLSSPSKAISNQDENVDVASELAHPTEKERDEIHMLIEKMKMLGGTTVVPIVLTSAVTGAGIAKLHTLLKDIPAIDGGDHESSSTLNHNEESLFHVDEIFAIPPSKVYSENKEDHSADHGIVLCGHLGMGRLAIGDQLRLGPFPLEMESNSGDESPRTPRSASYCLDSGRRPVSRVLSSLLSKSLQFDHSKTPATPTDAGSAFLDVHVVSLRSLRLPVRSMEAGETGTVGVKPTIQLPQIPLSRARKGMVLTSASNDNLYGYRSFSAVFSASDFTNTASPTLILGGHAIVYINSIRAAVRITALALDEGGVRTEPSSPTEVFRFDDYDEQDTSANGNSMSEHDARIVFRFVSTMEWMEIGSRVLVVPTIMAAGPVTGPQVTFNGLNGFVGKVCDVFT